MCGIFGYIGKKENAAEIVLAGLKSLEYRGYDSWGVAVVPKSSLSFRPESRNLYRKEIPGQARDDNKRIVVKKRVGKIGDASVNELPSSTLAFGHTRWATHGGVTEKNAHPHLDCTGKLALIHNGIIENYAEIKKKLLKKGHRFISETDTEVAIHLIEEFYKAEPLPLAVRKAFSQLEGLNAIIVLPANTRQLIAVRNGSPLIVGFGDGENYLASDAAALLPHTKLVHFLEDDEMAILTDKKIIVSNVKTGKPIQQKRVRLTWTVSQSALGRFPHFMLKEIHEQPQIVADITMRLNEVQKLASLIQKAHGAYLVGCGTAYYAALAGTYLFSKIARRHINAAVGSEFGYHLDFLNEKSLVIALSQSGETMDILESVKKAKDKGARIAALVNVLGSTLYREAHTKFLLGAGPEKSVASTKAFTAKLALLTLTAYVLAGKEKAGVNVINMAVTSSKHILIQSNIDRIKKLTRQLKNASHLYVVGRGLSYPASLETALKIKEISYIHAEGFAAGELKHGVIALIEKGTPCIVFAPHDESYGANLAGAMELKARGGYIIGISDQPHEVFDEYLPVEDAKEATIIPNVITAQLLAYYLAVERHLDPDKPRNLAKSVTVK